MRDEFEKLLFDINECLEVRLDPTDLRCIFNKWWPNINKEVVKVFTDPRLHAEGPRKRDQRDLIEEILRRVQSIQGVLEEIFPGKQLEASQDLHFARY